MPYISSGIRLSEKQDRRRKLTSEQKDEIRRLYNTGAVRSTRKLAKRYQVDKSTISIIVNPKRAEAVHQRAKEHWRDYVPSKEKKAAIAREHRHYKQELYLKGELKKSEE